MGIYNVLDYVPSTEHSAILDGTSTYDATTAIQQLLDITDARKTIVFPQSGRICQSDRLYFRTHNITIRGENCELMHIGQNQLCNIWIQGYNNIRIQEMRINGNYTNRPASSLPGEAGIYFLNCENFVMRDVEAVLTFNDGITIAALGTAETRSRIGYLENIKTEATGRNGISFCGCFDITVLHLQAKNNNRQMPMAGIAFEPDNNLTNENITLIEPSSQWNSGHGMYLSGSNVAINILGGRFANNGGYGISKGGSSPQLVGGSIFTNNVLGSIGA